MKGIELSNNLVRQEEGGACASQESQNGVEDAMIKVLRGCRFGGTDKRRPVNPKKSCSKEGKDIRDSTRFRIAK